MNRINASRVNDYEKLRSFLMIFKSTYNQTQGFLRRSQTKIDAVLYLRLPLLKCLFYQMGGARLENN